MTATTEVPSVARGGGGPGTWQRVRENADVRRLVACLLAGVVFALMTGPDGSVGDPTKGFRESWAMPRILLFLGLGVALWAVTTGWIHDWGGVRTRSKAAGAVTSRVTARRSARWTMYGVLFGATVVVPLALTETDRGILVNFIGIYVLLALGLNVVVGFAGLLDLGYIAFYAIGAYTAAYFAGALPVKPFVELNLFWVFPLGVIAAMLAGVILGTPTLRLRGDYLAIVTLGFGEIIEIAANNMTSVTGGAQGVTMTNFTINIGGLHYEWSLAQLPYYYLLLVIVVLVLIAMPLLENSRVGRAWVAIREDEVAAEATGINALKYKVMAFAIGASTSGLAGVFFAGKNNFFDPPTFSINASILVLVLVIFGGMGSIPGVVIGAAVLQELQQLLRDYIPQQDLYVYIGALLMIMMIFRPQGILPSRRRSRELGLAEAGVGTADAMARPGAAP